MRLSSGTEAPQACILEVSGVARARRECDFTQQQETYSDGGRTTYPPPPLQIGRLHKFPLVCKIAFPAYTSDPKCSKNHVCSASVPLNVSLHKVIRASIVSISPLSYEATWPVHVTHLNVSCYLFNASRNEALHDIVFIPCFFLRRSLNIAYEVLVVLFHPQSTFFSEGETNLHTHIKHGGYKIIKNVY
jgi:hypothetical protein